MTPAEAWRFIEDYAAMVVYGAPQPMKQFNRIDFQFEEALVNLLAYWFSEQDGGVPEKVPELMYRLGWLLDRGMQNYGDIGIGELADVLKDEACKRGYAEELYDLT